MSIRRADGVHTSVMGESIEVPHTDIVSFMFHNTAPGYAMTEKRLKAPAIIDSETGVTQSYGQLIADSIDVAKGLKALGCRERDVVLIISSNNYYFPTAIYGAFRAGLAISTCNPMYVLQEIVHQLEDCQATAILAHPSCAALVARAAAQVGLSTDKIIVMPDMEDMSKLLGALTKEIKDAGTFRTVHGLIDLGRKTNAAVQTGWVNAKPGEMEKRLGYLIYSSGTTGKPKGVMLSHANVLTSQMQLERLDGNTDYREFHTRTAGVVPMYHIFGLTTVMIRTLLHGGSIVIIPTYSLKSYLETVSKYGCTLLHLVPPQLLQLAKDPIVTNYDLSKVERIFCAAAPYSWDTVRELQARLGRPIPVKNAWGMSELSPVGSQCPSPGFTAMGRSWQAPDGSCGMVVAGSQIKLVDPATGKVAEVEKEGEIWIKGGQVMMGYLGNEKANEETFVDKVWMRTGDIAWVVRE